MAGQPQAALAGHPCVRYVAVAQRLVALARQRYYRACGTAFLQVSVTHLAQAMKGCRSISEHEVHIGELPMDADSVPPVVDRSESALGGFEMLTRLVQPLLEQIHTAERS